MNLQVGLVEVHAALDADDSRVLASAECVSYPLKP